MLRTLVVASLALILTFHPLHAAPPDQEAKTADKGPYPWEYQAIVKQFMSEKFFDPASAVDLEMTRPTSGWWRATGSNRITFCWVVTFTANLRNRLGGYVGKRRYAVYIRDARVLGHAEFPWDGQAAFVFNSLKARGEEEFKAEWNKLTPEEQQKAQQHLESGSTGEQARDLSYIEELKQLAALKEQGIITEEEFTAKKRQLLGLENGGGPEDGPPEKPPGSTL